MGDSLGRKYYFGLLAALGHPSPLAHDAAAAKHEDLRFEVEGTGPSVAFHWRPYAKEVQAQLAQWGATGATGRPDVAVLSFGLWDTLHETPASEVGAAVGGIAEAVAQGKAGRPGAFTAWLVPTAVVDGKLLTEEKRAHMTDAQVEAAARGPARASALPGAVDVVLEGGAVTKGLDARSEDGVHYDDGVYEALVQMGSNAYGAFVRGQSADAQAAQDKGGKRRQRQRLLLDDVADWEAWEEVVEGEVGTGMGTHRRLAGGAGGAGPKPKEIDGSMSSPMHGAFILVVVALMLLTMDSYAGFSWLGLWLARADTSVTWEESYEPLLSKILRASPAASSMPSGGGVGGGGSGHHHSHSGVGGTGAAVRGRYTPVPQGEIELGGVDQPVSPTDSGGPNEE